MVDEPRKATDVLLGIEAKVNTLLGIVRSQDHLIKILSNKLNDVMDQMKQGQSAAPKFTVETTQVAPVLPPSIMPPSFSQLPAGDPARNIPIVADMALPQTDSPQGFRRTSRPETFSGDNSYLPRTGVQEPRMPVQMPQLPQKTNVQQPSTDVIVPSEATTKKKAIPHQTPPQPVMNEERPEPVSLQGQIPVIQRVVDKNGKSIFLAEVEIIDISTHLQVFKTRTNGTGKWMASLGVGAYQVKITKLAALGKPSLEAIQDIQVDGSKAPLELPMLIIK